MEKLIAIQIDTHEKVGKAYTNFKKAPKERIVLGYVESRLETLEKYWSTFKNGHDQLVSGVPAANRRQIPYFEEDVFDQFEELYYTYKGDLKTAIEKLRQNKTAVERDNPSTSPKNEVKLPRITLPVFSGNYNEWQSFYDLFSALIHRNNALENVQKLHYLKSNLAGEAEALLRQFPITGDNYETAWQILIKRYSNKRYITNCIFKRLFGQKPLSQESSHGLKQLLDTTVECINALKNQKLPVQYWDAIIIYIVVSKLYSESYKQWEETISADGSDEIPSFDKLSTFLETRFRTLEMIESSNKSLKPVKPKVFHTAVSAQCSFCQDNNHYIFNCKKFVKLPTDERYKFVQSNGLCFNCLVPNHSVLKCKQSTTCRICSKKHHSLLHVDRKRTENENEGDRKSHKDQEEEIKVTSHFSIQEQPGQNVLLATALVDVPSRNGKIHVCRALIDQGSQASFVTENMVQLLGLKRKKINGVVSGIGEGNKSTKSIVEFTLRSRCDTTFTIQVQAYVLNKLTTYLPSQNVDLGWSKLATLDLADPTFNFASKIDILLGAAVLSKIIESGLIKGPFGIVAQSTRLGWILSGEVSSTQASGMKIVSMHTHTLDNDILKKFWEIDSQFYSTTKIMSKEEMKMRRYL